MKKVKITGCIRKLKKAGLYQIGVRKGHVLRVHTFVNCTAFFLSSTQFVVPRKCYEVA